MSSIIPYDESIIRDTSNLPVELVRHIVKMGDLCYIITKGPMGIEVRHFYTNQIIKTIETFTLLHISVSPLINGCIYVVGSNSRSIGIWNIYSSELITEFESSYIPEEDDWCYTRLSNSGEPTHTFTPNNNLLIASGYKIKVYTLESNMWVNTNTVELPSSDIIIACITSNLTTNLFACGTIGGDVYIYNINGEFIHELTTREPLMRSDHLPSITSLAFNQNKLVISSVGRNNRLLDLSTMNSIKIEEPDREMNGSYFIIYNYKLTPCLTRFIGTIHFRTYLWDAVTGRVIRRLDFTLSDFSFSPNNKYISSYNDWNRDFLVIEYNRI